MKKKPEEKPQKVVRLAPPSDRLVTLELKGTMPVLQDRMLEKEREIISFKTEDGESADKPTDKGVRRQQIIDMSKYKEEHWAERAHYDQNTKKLGHPTEGFLKSVGSMVKYVKLTCSELIEHGKDINRCMRILGNGWDQDGAPICLFDKGTIKHHVHWATPPKNRTPIPVHRPGICDWTMSLQVEFNAAIFKDEDILMLFNRAGRFIGIGAWRPENRGLFGTFSVEKARFQDINYLPKRPDQEAA